MGFSDFSRNAPIELKTTGSCSSYSKTVVYQFSAHSEHFRARKSIIDVIPHWRCLSSNDDGQSSLNFDLYGLISIPYDSPVQYLSFAIFRTDSGGLNRPNFWMEKNRVCHFLMKKISKVIYFKMKMVNPHSFFIRMASPKYRAKAQLTIFHMRSSRPIQVT